MRRWMLNIVVALVLEFSIFTSLLNLNEPRVEFARDAEINHILEVLKSYRTGLSSLEEVRLAEVILNESYTYDIDPLFVLALIKTESTFFNWARSEKGALGLMQIRPITGRYLAEKLGVRWDGEDILYDPYLNIKMGIHYFSLLMDRYNNDVKKALAAYNFGPFYIERRLRYGKRVPERYANKVLATYDRLKKGVGFG